RQSTITENCRASETHSTFARSSPTPCEEKQRVSPNPRARSPQCINTWRLTALRSNCRLTTEKEQYCAGLSAGAIRPKNKKESPRAFRWLKRTSSYEDRKSTRLNSSHQ